MIYDFTVLMIGQRRLYVIRYMIDMLLVRWPPREPIDIQIKPTSKFSRRINGR